MNILMVVTSTGSPSADNTFLHDRLVAAGHTVTYIASSATPSFAGVDLVILHGTSQTNIGTKYDATTVPVMGIANNPHSLFVSASGAAASASNSVYVLPAANGDPLVGGLTGTIAVSTAGTPTAGSYNTDTTYSSATVKVIAVTSALTTRIMLARLPAGGLLSDGTTSAPSRRLVFTLPTGFVNYNANGLAILDNSVTWVSTPALTASAGSNSTVAVQSTVNLAASATNGTAPYSYAWTHLSGPSTTGGLSSTTAQAPTYTAPISASTADVWQVTVTDSASATATATVTKSYSNSAPVVNAGVDVTTQATGTPTSTTFDVTLSVSATDPEGSTLTYSTAVTTTNSGSATIISPTSQSPIVRASKYGFDGIVTTTATDTGGVSGTDTAAVIVNPVAYEQIVVSGALVNRQLFVARSGALV